MAPTGSALRRGDAGGIAVPVGVWPWWPNRDAGDACGIASGPAADPTTSTSWWVRPMAPVPATLPAALRDHGVNSLPAGLALIRKVGSEPINEASLAVIDGALPL